MPRTAMRIPAAVTVGVVLVFGLTASAQPVGPGPIAQAIPSAAARLAASGSAAMTGGDAIARPDAGRAQWRQVLALNPGSAIVLRLKDAADVHRFVVDADLVSLTVAERWGAGPSGEVYRVPKTDVVQVSVLRKHVGRHTGRGTLIGAAIGGLVLGVSTATMDACTGEYCSAAGMAALGALGGGIYGTGIGAFVGAVAPRSPDVVYRAATQP